MTTIQTMRSRRRRSDDGGGHRDARSSVKKLFLAAFVVVYTFVVCGMCANINSNDGLMRGRRRIGEDEGFFFVSANPGGAEEEDERLKKLELELEKAKSDLSHARKEKRSVEEKLNVDLNEMRRTKREVELELQKSKSAIDEAKVNLEKTREEKEKFERSLRETKEEFVQKSSNDLKTEFVHFWEALKTFAEAATSDGKAKAKEGLEGLKAHSKVFAELLKEKTSGLAVVAKVKSLEIGQLASKKAMEFDLPKKYETAKVKAKKEVMPKVKSAYGEVTKQVKSGVKKVQPQLTKAKKFVQEKTPKEAKEYATRAFLFLTAAREELVKVLAAKLLMVYQNVDFFAPYATKSNAMFSSYVLVQTLMYYLAYRTVSRLLFGRKKAKGDNNKNVTKKAAKAVPKEVKGRSVEFSPPKTRATRIAAPFAAKRTTA